MREVLRRFIRLISGLSLLLGILLFIGGLSIGDFGEDNVGYFVCGFLILAGLFGFKQTQKKEHPVSPKMPNADSLSTETLQQGAVTDDHRQFDKQLGQKPKNQDVVFNDDFVEIPKLNFLGQYSSSPNGEYSIAWMDSDGKGRGGARSSGHGQYVLIRGHTVITHGKMQRPNDGKVANNGTFVINDWLFNRTENNLRGDFYAINSQGEILIRKRYQANLYSCGISPDGKFAVCQTAYSPHKDGGTLTLFDLTSRKALWQIEPYEWGNNYKFDVENNVVYVIGRNEEGWRYALNSGEFLDEERATQKWRQEANGFELYHTVQHKRKTLHRPPTDEEFGEFVSMLEDALERGMHTYPNWKAKVHRALGELWEQRNEDHKALEHYELALSLDSRIGVKRKIGALRKKLGKD